MPSPRDQAVDIVNRYEQILQRNIEAFRAGQISAEEAQRVFNDTWQKMTAELSTLGEEGRRALMDRGPGGRFDWTSMYSPRPTSLPAGRTTAFWDWTSGQYGPRPGESPVSPPQHPGLQPWQNYTPNPPRPAHEDPYGFGQYTGWLRYAPPLPPTGSTRFTTAEPLQMAEQNRMRAAEWFDSTDRELRDALQRYAGMEEGYQDWLLYGPGGYREILGGRGGFSPDEARDILQYDYVRGALAGDDELARMLGDPYLPVRKAGEEVNYYNQLVNAASALQMGALDPLRARLEAAVDPAKLGLSREFLERYDVTPRDLQDIVDAAGQSVGLRTQAERDELRRALAAQGQTSPLAEQAALNRLKVRGDIDAADAMTRARIEARRLGLDTALGREQMRLGAERDISGRLRDIGSEIGQSEIATARNVARDWQDFGRYRTGLMSDFYRTAEAQQADRMARMLGTRYGQRMGAAEALSDRYGRIYGQRKAEEAEARGMLRGMYGAAQEGAATTRQQRIGAAGQQFGAIGTATGQAIEAKYIPDWAKRFLGI